MRIAITGSSGFLGTVLVQELTNAGHDVCLLVRSSKNFGSRKSSDIIVYDSLNSSEVSKLLHNWQPDVFYHLAWEGVVDKRNDENVAKRNIELTKFSVRLASVSGCSKWIGIGSQAEYGIQNKMLSETDHCQPQTEYGRSKLVAGIEALNSCNKNGLNGVWSRVFSVYGPGDHSNTLLSYVTGCFNSGIKPSLSNGQQYWDFLYITDAASALVALMNERTNGIYNVASGTTALLKDVVEMIQKKMGYDGKIGWGEIPDGDLNFLCGNIDKIKQTTEWPGPVVGLTDGIDSIISLKA